MTSTRAKSVALALGVTLAITAHLSAQQVDQPTAVGDDPPLVTKVYRVSDLVLPVPDYSFRGINFPGTGDSPRGGINFGGGMGGMGMGGMGMGGMGMGGGMGGSGSGFFSVPPGATTLGQIGGGEAGTAQVGPRRTMTKLRFDMEELIEAIISTVAPDTWDARGGIGSIAPLANMLIVRQTSDIHQQLAQLLDELRRQGGTVTSVTLRAHWVLLDADQLRKVAPKIDSSDWQAGRGEINRDALNQFASTGGAVGQITCFSGQTVHIISGNCRNWISGAVPVVGQLDRATHAPALVQRDQADRGGPVADPTSAPSPDPRHYLAQTPKESGGGHFTGGPFGDGTGQAPSARGVGYQPITTFGNFGTLLQITPVLVPDSDAVILDLQSSVMRPKESDNKTVDYLGVMSIDRVNLVVQQFMTTLAVPLGRPVLVGGSTLEPVSGQATSPEQLYLVIEATN
jgi:hypothetical protein